MPSAASARMSAYLVSAAVLIAIYTSLRAPLPLLLLGPFVAFFATGYFSGFGAVTAEIYPTDIRATAQGFTYNLGRIASAAAPFTVGTLAQTRGFDVALSTTSVAFVLAALLWILDSGDDGERRSWNVRRRPRQRATPARRRRR